MKMKKDGTPDLRCLPKAVRILIKKANQEQNRRSELEAQHILSQDKITSDDLNKIVAGSRKNFLTDRFIR